MSEREGRRQGEVQGEVREEGPAPPRRDNGRRVEGHPLRDPVVRVIVASTLMGVMGVSLISPVLPEVRRALSLSEAEASLVLSAFTLPGIVLGLFIGMWADRWGRRAVLVPCLLVYGVSGAAVGLAPGFGSIIALRVLQGAAASGLVTLAITLVGDLFQGPRRNAVLGLNGALLAVGTGAYPVIGGALSLIDWRAPFVLYLVGVPVGLFALRVLEDPPRRARPGGLEYLRQALRELPIARAAVLYATALGVFTVLYGAVLTLLPFLLDGELGLSPLQIGIVVSVSSLASATAASQAGRLARRFRNEPIIAAGVLSLGVGVAGISLAPSPVAFAVAVLPFGAGMGTVMPALDSAVSSLTPDEYRGGAMSLRTSMVRLGQTIGPALFTGVAAAWSARGLLLLTGLLLLGFASVALGRIRRGSR